MEHGSPTVGPVWTDVPDIPPYALLFVHARRSLEGKVSVNISDIDALLVVIDVGTYRAAADVLHLNDHSAVAKQIRRLERSLRGVRLVKRNDYGMAVLTDVGKQLLPQLLLVKQAHDALSVSLTQMIGRDAETSGPR